VIYKAPAAYEGTLLQKLQPPGDHGTQQVLIIHEVDGYPVWKAIFDNAAEIRKNAGEIRYQLLRDDQDENLIVHLSCYVLPYLSPPKLRHPKVFQAIRSNRSTVTARQFRA